MEPRRSSAGSVGNFSTAYYKNAPLRLAAGAFVPKIEEKEAEQLKNSGAAVGADYTVNAYTGDEQRPITVGTPNIWFGFIAMNTNVMTGAKKRIPLIGMPGNRTAGFAAHRAFFRGLTCCFLPSVSQRLAFGFLTAGAGAGGFTGGFDPDVSQGFTIGILAAGTGVGGFAGGFDPDVSQGFAIGILAAGTGAGRFAGGFDPGVSQGLAVGILAAGTGVGGFAGGFEPDVSQRLALNFLAFRTDSGAGACGINPLVVAR